MRLDSYFPLTRCTICKRTVYVVKDWIGRQLDGTFAPAPKYKTCKHPVKDPITGEMI